MKKIKDKQRRMHNALTTQKMKIKNKTNSMVSISIYKTPKTKRKKNTFLFYAVKQSATTTYTSLQIEKSLSKADVCRKSKSFCTKSLMHFTIEYSFHWFLFSTKRFY